MHRVHSPSPYLNCPRFTLNMKVWLWEVSPWERRERKHKLLPLLCESRTCWNSKSKAKTSDGSADPQRCSPLHCALVSQSLSLTDFSLLVLSLLLLSLSLRVHCHFTIQGFLCLWHWNLCCGAEMVWWRMICTSSSKPPRTPPHSLLQAQRAV